MLYQILPIVCHQSLRWSQRDRFGLGSGTSLPQDAEHSEQRGPLPRLPGALAKKPPQKGFDGLLVHLAEPATRPNKPPVKVSHETKVIPNRSELVPLLMDVCNVRLDMRTQRSRVQALYGFEFGKQCFHAQIIGGPQFRIMPLRKRRGPAYLGDADSMRHNLASGIIPVMPLSA